MAERMPSCLLNSYDLSKCYSRIVNSRAFLKRVTYSKKIQSKHYVIPMVRIVERDVYIYNTPSNTCSGTFV